MPSNPSFEKLKSGFPDHTSVDYLIENLSASEFSSLMLEITRLRTARVSPVELLRNFENNRFTHPSKINPIHLLETEVEWLKKANEAHFSPILLSPVSPLGTCSAVAKVNQNNVISALRNVEVIADATNVLALQLSQDFKYTSATQAIRYATVHRHVRTQLYKNPNFTAHFGIFCMASAARDRGSFDFELDEANRHIGLIINILESFFSRDLLTFKFFLRDENPNLKRRLEDKGNCWSTFQVVFETDSSQEYYRLFQFKIYLSFGDNPIDLADGGPVDWVKSMTGNQKMRSFISGIGLELVLKLAGTV